MCSRTLARSALDALPEQLLMFFGIYTYQELCESVRSGESRVRPAGNGAVASDLESQVTSPQGFPNSDIEQCLPSGDEE